MANINSQKKRIRKQMKQMKQNHDKMMNDLQNVDLNKKWDISKL